MDQIERLHRREPGIDVGLADDTANNCGSNRLPITEAACRSARSFGARRSTRAVRRLCTLAGRAAATALASKSNLPRWCELCLAR